MILNSTKSSGNDNPLVDQGEIVRSLTAIVAPDQIIEVRALNAKVSGDYNPATYSGYFEASNLAGLAAATATITEADGIYFVVNPVEPSLLARAVNKLRRCGKADPTTSDKDIVNRRFLLIDADPVRAAKISSSDCEHEAALDRAVRIADALSGDGWPDPIFGDSGNGAHLLYPIDEPTDDGGLIHAALVALNNRFGDDVVKVDLTVFNPARIWKLYGTRACKGDPEAERLGRPHRMSKILSLPEVRAVVRHEQLVALVERYGTQPAAKKATAAGTTTVNGFDIDTWITTHNLNVSEATAYKGGRKWDFEVCPFNSDHNDGSAVLLQLASGALVFKCHHNGCIAHDWHALRAKFEPREELAVVDYSGIMRGADNIGTVYTVTPPPGTTTAMTATTAPRLLIRTAGELSTAFPVMRPAVVRGLLRQGESMNVVAPSKVGKSWLSYDLALAVVTGRPWLGFETTPGEVLILDNELHPETLAARLPVVASTRGIMPDEYESRLHVVNLRGALVDLPTLCRMMNDIEAGRFRLIIVDALYRMIPKGTDENSNADMQAIYNEIDQLGGRLESAISLVHHASKGVQGDKSVTDTGAGAGAISRAADTHLVLREHEDPGAYVLDAACRSWPRIAPRCLRWTPPTWEPADELDPAKVKRARGGGGRPKKSVVEKPAPPAKLTFREFASKYAAGDPRPRASILAMAVDDGVSYRQGEKLFDLALGAEVIVTAGKSVRTNLYALAGGGLAHPPDENE